MTTDTRPPLYLTSGDAANWRRTHPEDADREIVIVESATLPCPPEVVEAWHGFGRWETGLTGGAWPERTLFSDLLLAHLPSTLALAGPCVLIRGAGVDAVYLLDRSAAPPVPGSVIGTRLVPCIGGEYT